MKYDNSEKITIELSHDRPNILHIFLNKIIN